MPAFYNENYVDNKLYVIRNDIILLNTVLAIIFDTTLYIMITEIMFIPEWN